MSLRLRMLFSLPPLALLLLTTCAVRAQNQPPQITIKTFEVTAPDRKVTIGYDVADTENDQVTVTPTISLDSGRTYQRSGGTVTGDAGAPMQPGMGKQLVWTFTAAEEQMLAGRSLTIRLVADDGKPADIQELVDRVDSSRLRNDLQSIIGIRHRTAGVPHLTLVKSMITTHFDVHGLRSSKHTFDYSGYTAENLIGDQPGLVAGDSVVIIDGHFDTVPVSPGADDNGSAIAGVMEAIRALQGIGFRKTVRFIGFDVEEGGLIGSTRYVQSGLSKSDKIAGVLNMEMIGYYSSTANSQTIPPGFSQLFPATTDSIKADSSRGNFITVVANASSDALGKAYIAAARQYVPTLRALQLTVPGTGSIAPDLRRSDHAPFWDAAKPAIQLTDGANFRNPNYHQATDTIGTINFDFMSKVVRAVVATAATLAGPMHAGTVTSDQFTIGSSSAVPSQGGSKSTGSVVLEQNHPNPFAAASTIRISLPTTGNTSLKIFDMQGAVVATLIDGRTSAGEYSIDVEADHLGLAPGVYVYRLEVDGTSLQRSMVVVR